MPVTYIVQQLNTIRSFCLRCCCLSGVLVAAFSFLRWDTLLLLTLALSVISFFIFLEVWKKEFSKIENFENDFQNRIFWALGKHGWRIWWLKPAGTFIFAFIITLIILSTLLSITSPI